MSKKLRDARSGAICEYLGGLRERNAKQSVVTSNDVVWLCHMFVFYDAREPKCKKAQTTPFGLQKPEFQAHILSRYSFSGRLYIT